MTNPSRPPVPPFDETSARQKCSRPRPRGTPVIPNASPARTRWTRCGGTGHEFIERTRPRSSPSCERSGIRELDYVLRKELWAFHDNRIAVRFQYEWHDRERPVVPSRTATRTGSSTPTASCGAVRPASTTSRSRLTSDESSDRGTDGETAGSRCDEPGGHHVDRRGTAFRAAGC